jgi:hypothetical protein
VSSFNYEGVSDNGNFIHLADQYYRVCLRREKGRCSIAWTQDSATDSFKARPSSPHFVEFSRELSVLRRYIKITGNALHPQLSRPSTTYTADTLYGTGCNPDYIRIGQSPNSS